MQARRTAVLFVCLGNICRSPLAEGVFRALVRREGLESDFHIDSAGTGSWHAGEPPDARSAKVAAEHGITLDHRARQVRREDLERFDFVIAMDRENLSALQRMANGLGGARLHLLREFEHETDGEEVPDPYYGGPSGFDEVFEMVRRSCEGLLRELRARAG
jgi:protein-tyrosine phosphatase